MEQNHDLRSRKLDSVDGFLQISVNIWHLKWVSFAIIAFYGAHYNTISKQHFIDWRLFPTQYKLLFCRITQDVIRIAFYASSITVVKSLHFEVGTSRVLLEYTHRCLTCQRRISFLCNGRSFSSLVTLFSVPIGVWIQLAAFPCHCAPQGPILARNGAWSQTDNRDEMGLQWNKKIASGFLKNEPKCFSDADNTCLFRLWSKHL